MLAKGSLGDIPKKTAGNVIVPVRHHVITSTSADSVLIDDYSFEYKLIGIW